MTYEDDPNRRIDRRMGQEETGYAGWIAGGIVVLAVIVSVFAMTRGTDNSTTASNPTTSTERSTPAAPGPSTTGSGSTTPAPAGR